MDTTEVIQMVNKLLFSKTGKHLDYLQDAIIRGTLQGQTYGKIAEQVYTSEGHVRDVGSELWKLLSELFGEDITKANFRVILEKATFYNSSSAIVSDNVTVHNVNICTDPHLTQTGTKANSETSTQLHIDLGDAPEIFSFYGRENEVFTLENWIVNEHSKLVAILGISGIGKTTLSIHLIHQIKNHFDYVIYRSLRFSPTLEATLTNLLQFFSPDSEIPQNIEYQFSALLKHLRRSRCLIILDDVQMLFSRGELSGQYKPGYENYSLFFKWMAEASHNSCLLINSGEKPVEVAKLEKENSPVHSLILESLGVAAKEILREQKLLNEDSWETLITFYQGNPLWLELTALAIRELFEGKVSEFLKYDPLILDESLQVHLDQQFQRLAEVEKPILIYMAHQPNYVTLAEIVNALNYSPCQALNAIKSLKMRFLLSYQEQENINVLSVNTVLKQYIQSRFKDA